MKTFPNPTMYPTKAGMKEGRSQFGPLDGSRFYATFFKLILNLFVKSQQQVNKISSRFEN